MEQKPLDDRNCLEAGQLEEVSGGGILDTKALEDALFDDMSIYPDLANVYRQARSRVPNIEDPEAYNHALAKEMLDIMGIDATIRPSGANNTYSYKGREISQSDVIWVINGYKESRLYRRDS